MAQYSQDYINRLHLVWGTGFMSPGGPEEVTEIVRGLNLRDATVLDVGCGTGGPAIVLARDMGAHVTGIDVEPHVLDNAKSLARTAGVEDRIGFRLVEPGPLSFEADSFDVVFSKDSLIHIPDKQSLYREILRVLKPGGTFAASDWLSGESAADDEAFQRLLSLTHLDFTPATANETAAIMREVGFERVETTDRNAWYAALSAQEVQDVEGPLHDQLIAVSDAETVKNWLAFKRAVASAAKSGGLRPTHLRGYRPTSIR